MSYGVEENRWVDDEVLRVAREVGLVVGWVKLKDKSKVKGK